MLQIKRKMGPKGQIVLPKDVREHFNLTEGSEIVFMVDGPDIRIKSAVDPVKFVEDFCILKQQKPAIAHLRSIMDEKYQARAKR